MKRFQRILFIIISLIVFACILFLILCPIINNFSAQKVKDDICAIPLPKATIKLEEVSRAGKLVGNGNGMQFFGAILLESALSLEELDKYYSQYRDHDWSYLVEKQDTQNIQVIEHGTLSFSSDVSDKNCYIVYSWGEGISPFADFDLRGN